MTGAELLSISPLIALGATAVAILVVLSFYRSHRLTVCMTLAGLAAALALMATEAWRLAPADVTPLLRMDGLAVFFGSLVIAAALFCSLLAADYLPRHGGRKEEFYILLLLATLGAAALAASVHLASFFLALEILSVSLYSLIAYYRRSALGLEAGTKYLVLAASSSAVLLFGLAILYAWGGEMNLAKLAAKIAQDDKLPGTGGYLKDSVPMLASMALVLVGVGFKLALAPFHLWTADVYQGAPAPVTALIATVSKGAVFAVLLRWANLLGWQNDQAMHLMLLVLAIASMLGGNLLALMQQDLKRVLAYSSISHMGYLLVALLAGGAMAATTVAFYLAAYFVATLGAFTVVSALEGPQVARSGGAHRALSCRGLFFHRPELAVIFTLMLLSLAGLPLTAGFMGKFLLLRAGMDSRQWAGAGALIVSSGIGLFYYLRIALSMYSRPLEHPPQALPERAIGLASAVVLWTTAGLLIAIGVLPEPLLRLIELIM